MDNNNPQNQSLRPPAIGSQGFGTNYSMQFRPGVPAQPGHPYMQPASGAQQYHQIGQPDQFSQPMQQMPARPGQPAPSLQPMPMSYMQPPQYQNPGAGPGVPHSSYAFTAPPFGKPTNVSSQFHAVSQMHTPVALTGGQPCMPSGNQGPGNVTPVSQPGQQPSTTAPTISLHPMVEYHGAARAVGGCAIYFSDKPGHHDFNLLKKLVLPDGSTLRANFPGRPTKDCLFTDPTTDGKRW